MTSPKRPPETADHDLEELRRTLQNQRKAKADALQNAKRTTMQAVKCYDTPTTYLDPAELRKRLAEDEETAESDQE